MALDPSIVLLIGADAAIVDESSFARTLTAFGNAARTTAQAKFGAGSLTFDGAGDRVQVPTSGEISLAAGDFTIEGWYRFVTKADSQALVGDWGATTAASCWFFYVAGGNLLFRGVTGGTLRDVQAAFVPTLGQWYHLAVDRQGSTVRVYVNGAVIATDAAFSISLNTSTGAITLGTIGVLNGFPTFDYNGQMDEVRITKGVAQYHGAFTPPTGPFPRDSTTSASGTASFTFTGSAGSAASINGVGAASVAFSSSGVTRSAAVSSGTATFAFQASGKSPVKSLASVLYTLTVVRDVTRTMTVVRDVDRVLTI